MPEASSNLDVIAVGQDLAQKISGFLIGTLCQCGDNRLQVVIQVLIRVDQERSHPTVKCGQAVRLGIGDDFCQGKQTHFSPLSSCTQQELVDLVLPKLGSVLAQRFDALGEDRLDDGTVEWLVQPLKDLFKHLFVMIGRQEAQQVTAVSLASK